MSVMPFGRAVFADETKEESIESEDVQLRNEAARKALFDAYNQQQANFERLKTWQAKVDVFVLSGINRSHLRGVRLKQKADNDKQRKAAGESNDVRLIAPYEVKATFVWDKTSGSFLSTFESTTDSTCFDEATGDEYERETFGQNVRVLAKRDGLFTFHPDELRGEIGGFERPASEQSKSTRVVTREPPEHLTQIRNYSYAFDPTVMFEVGGWRIDTLIEGYSDDAVKPALKNIMNVKKSPNGDITVTRIYRTTNDGKVTTTNVIEFDSRFSFLPKRATMTSNERILLQQIDWQYETVNGVLVPKTYVIQKRDFNGVFSLSRTCSFVDQKVNATLPADQFDVISLGLQDGDRIIDRIDERSFEIKNGKPVPF
ncbi:MAG: hypothetical protein WEB58_03780 [Planctomycetaceae bacterium]